MEDQAVPIIVGKKIRALRKAAGISQDALALGMDMARSFCGPLEEGEQNMSITTLVRIAKGLKVNACELLKDIGF
ncbi:MAG: transcriptional regulator [Gammaproteobacteria bacterium]|jgi:transcriptional regulator with XRE-family HTH domain|nr:transcriptional regulator [Gammaproteobacteria bacterium]